MPIQRLLALISGRVQEYVPVDASAGAGDAGKVVALGTAGQLDLTMMPTGIGPDTKQLPATEAIAAGAPISIWSNAGVISMRNSDGSTAGKSMDGFVLAAVASGATGTAYFAGLNTAATGLTPGAPVYLGDGAGTYATAGPTTAGHTWQQVGVALSPTTLQFAPQLAVVRA